MVLINYRSFQRAQIKVNFELLKLILSRNLRFFWKIFIFSNFEFFATAPNLEIISLSENKLSPGPEGLCQQRKSSTSLCLQQGIGIF